MFEYKGHFIDLVTAGRNEYFVIDYMELDCVWCDTEAEARRIIDEMEGE